MGHIGFLNKNKDVYVCVYVLYVHGNVISRVQSVYLALGHNL